MNDQHQQNQTQQQQPEQPPHKTIPFYYSDGDDSIRFSYKVTDVIVDTTTQRGQHVEICNTPAFGKVLIMDGLLQSVLVQVPMLAHPSPKRVLILGGGELATAREVLKHNSVETCVMVEWDEQVVDLCKRHLPNFNSGVIDDKRLQIHYNDALEWLKQEHTNIQAPIYTSDVINSTKYDVIIMDTCDPNWDEPDNQLNKFFSDEYVRIMHDFLNDGGFVVFQGGDVTKFHPLIPVERIFQVNSSYGVFFPSFGAMWAFTITRKGEDFPSKLRNIETSKLVATTQSYLQSLISFDIAKLPNKNTLVK